MNQILIRLLLFKLDFLSSFINLTYLFGKVTWNPVGIHPEFRVLEEMHRLRELPRYNENQ
jgi:hypothetical protein